MRILLLLLLAPVLPLFYSCTNNEKEQPSEPAELTTLEYADSTNTADEKPLFTVLDSLQTGITFSNPITENEQINILAYEYLYNGGGVAAGDINNDGLTDLYFSGNMVPNKLYLNLGNFKFRDITATSGTDGGLGYKTGVTMADVNSDGLLDILVCKSMLADPQYRKKILYINNGNMTFTDHAAEYGIDDASFSTQGYFFDMDGDQDLDLYLLNHPFNFRESNNIDVSLNTEGKLEVVKPSDLTYITDKLYENKNGKFEDITKKAGLEEAGFGLSVVISDFNNDRKPDLYVCNDYIKPDYLYINNGNKTFSDKFSDYFTHSSFSSMGSDFADINNDGCLDLMTLDMLPRDRYRQNMLGMAQNFDKFQKMTQYGLQAQYSTNTLQLNNCNGSFSDIAFLSNTAYTDWSWATLMADFDNDGWKDIYVSNGYKRDVTNNDYARYKMDSLKKLVTTNQLTLAQWVQSIPSVRISSYLFRNNRNLSFSDVSKIWNSGKPGFSNGAAYSDLDNDGYLDLVINRIDEPALILRNQGKTSRNNHFIRFSLVGKNKKPAYGSKIRLVMQDGSSQIQEFYPGRGFLSSVEPVIHFGLGGDSTIAKAEIIWQDGRIKELTSLSTNKLHTITDDGTGKKSTTSNRGNFLFSDISNTLPREMVHVENNYIDFKREPLLHHKYSEEGPGTAVADINNDGLEDVFIGGAQGTAGKLFLQKKNGGFSLSSAAAFEADKDFEDVAAIFFDANGDGSKDLMVVSGGNERLANSIEYEDRLYLNDGKGNFTRSATALPSMPSSGGSIATSDFDKDGDSDLFIGGRVTPGRYPEPPASYLLRNDNGKFTDVTSELSDSLGNLGMITEAKFADLDKDGRDELIIAGEWMPVSVFKNENGKFRNVTASFGLSGIKGWWYSLEVADLNADGYPEIIAGNLGLNSQIQASAQKPVTLHYKDFDNNGSLDPILCCYTDDKSYPLHFRDRLLDQMVVLKKKFTRYEMYANATLDQIFTREQLKDAKILTANHFSHTLFINNGGKVFTPSVLPRYTQISAVRSIKALDVNKDGKTDLLLGGNFYGTDAQIGRYDASVGAVLLGDGKGHFQVIGPASSGFSIRGNVRAILPLVSTKGTLVLVVRNNDKVSLLKLK
jgi:enediyne biosynthesis protein E4